MSNDPLSLESMVGIVKMTLNDPYPYLDKCDWCDERTWVRFIDDGERQYCVRCDPRE
jgi:uncharacterized paraquat-inducible protein A